MRVREGGSEPYVPKREHSSKTVDEWRGQETPSHCPKSESQTQGQTIPVTFTEAKISISRKTHQQRYQISPKTTAIETLREADWPEVNDERDEIPRWIDNGHMHRLRKDTRCSTARLFKSVYSKEHNCVLSCHSGFKDVFKYSKETNFRRTVCHLLFQRVESVNGRWP